MSAPRPSCLIVLSAENEGVSAPSFIQAFTLTHRDMNLQLATPQGKLPEYVNQDDDSRRWLTEVRAKSFSVPISLDTIDPSRYTALLIPHSPGALIDLADNTELHQIINHFIEQRKPICAVGQGVAGLFCAKSKNGGKSWSFKGFSMTSTSVFELANEPEFASMTCIPEDYIKDHGAKYSCSEPGCVHVVIDRHLITGQNEHSTLTAVQNLILMCNQRHGKPVSSPH